MIYKIVYTPYAERDIWEIADYLSDFSVTTARQFLLTLKAKIEELADLPLKYPMIDPGLPYRKMVVDKYVVLYIVDDDRQEVLIMRVVHDKRNYRSEL